MGEDARLSAATMELFVLGTGHAVAPADVRERLHVDLADVSETLAHLLTERGVLYEAVPLPTCARLELYAVAPDADRAIQVLVRLMARRTGVPAADVLAHSYTLRGGDAVRHLFRVAAGLDSVIHGEAQILGQVREAAHDPRSAHGKGPVLHRLFEAALASGKRVRTETEIGRGAASLASAALSMLRREVGDLGSRTALVIGAGDTGSLMARLLRKAGIGRLVIANRTEETARELAKGLGAEGRGLSDLPALIAEADIVIGAAAGAEPLVTPELVEAAGARSPRPCRHYLDLAHPRSIDRAVAELPGARLIDLQDVFERVESARHARSAQIPRAERIVCEQADAFVRWHRSRDNVRVVRAMREQVLERAREEAERLSRGRTEREREEMTHFARRLARTLLHAPTVALRDADPGSAEGRALLETAEALFGINPGGPNVQDAP
ncbi:MAG TPA: glutamyl-tRNA reductase [Longimicrobiales bacterium]|nr:glutamyl-tRNA reductase [Longimicrobiales bacterium]